MGGDDVELAGSEGQVVRGRLNAAGRDVAVAAAKKNQNEWLAGLRFKMRRAVVFIYLRDDHGTGGSGGVAAAGAGQIDIAASVLAAYTDSDFTRFCKATSTDDDNVDAAAVAICAQKWPQLACAWLQHAAAADNTAQVLFGTCGSGDVLTHACAVHALFFFADEAGGCGHAVRGQAHRHAFPAGARQQNRRRAERDAQGARHCGHEPKRQC